MYLLLGNQKRRPNVSRFLRGGLFVTSQHRRGYQMDGWTGESWKIERGGTIPCVEDTACDPTGVGGIGTRLLLCDSFGSATSPQQKPTPKHSAVRVGHRVCSVVAVAANHRPPGCKPVMVQQGEAVVGFRPQLVCDCLLLLGHFFALAVLLFLFELATTTDGLFPALSLVVLDRFCRHCRHRPSLFFLFSLSLDPSQSHLFTSLGPFFHPVEHARHCRCLGWTLLWCTISAGSGIPLVVRTVAGPPRWFASTCSLARDEWNGGLAVGSAVRTFRAGWCQCPCTRRLVGRRPRHTVAQPRMHAS
eukprot:m.259434 g.259434  ORF g.259434 m.259434 type:complete len:303 (+) comp26636_c0_seq3:2-910(+)